MNDSKPKRVYRLATGWALFALSLLTTASRGEVAAWSEPALDVWAYSNAFNPGASVSAPTFGGIFVDTATNTFFENGSSGPARLGSMIIAFETSDLVQTGLSPAQYAINSVQVTTTLRSANGTVLYEENPVSAAGLLADALAGNYDGGQPVELFGAGFRNGLEGFDLGANPTGNRFDESTPTTSANGYQVYPAITDSSGSLVDVSNNLTGGFSATEPSETTAPFDATPWAIGSLNQTPGSAVAVDSTFTFDLDLSLPGIESYLQQSLSEGALGFVLSTVHPAESPIDGAGSPSAYPSWYTKEGAAIFGNPSYAPTLTINYSIQTALPGDYDSSGTVDQADYVLWRAQFGTSIAAGTGADGNGDGQVDAADYTVWRDALAPAATATAVTVPEPGAGVLLLGIVGTFAFCGGQCLLTRTRD